jgi:uncharacterized SAM-binding protein YcdF (DUF218 family)
LESKKVSVAEYALTVSKRISTTLLAAVVLIALAFFSILHAGSYLVVNNTKKSDAIVVLAGDQNDRRFWRGIELLRGGYGQHMQLDVPAGLLYGHTYAEQASNLIAHSSGVEQSKITLCIVTKDSTVEESANARRCLAQLQPAPQTVLLVTNDFHTRRALSIFRSRLPQYRWSTAAVFSPAAFGELWWQHREWAKTCFLEWLKLIWWELVESWHRG